MTDRWVPAPPSSGVVNLASWFDAEVNPGDRVIFPKAARYRTESVRLTVDDVEIVGRDSVLVSTVPPPPPVAGVWKAPLDLASCNRLTITDLLVEGPRPPGAPFNRDFEGQHGFAVHGGTDVTLCRCGSRGQYGDHVYLAAGARNITVCSHRGETQSGRNGVTTVDAADVAIMGGSFNALRTFLNFEVHEGESVDRWTAEGVAGAWTTRAITGTGEGDASDVTFRDLTGAGTHKLSIEVYGTGQPGTRDYGARNRWTVDGFTNVITPTKPDAYRMHYVNGLHLDNLPPYPMSTTGSTLV